MGGTAVSWAAAKKWAVRERGDAVSVLETHHGAICGVIVDVQGSGDGAGNLAWSLVSLAAQLAGEGGSAEGIASAVNRALWTRRGGRVQAAVGVVVTEPAGIATWARYGSVLVDGAEGSDAVDLDGSLSPAGIVRDADPWSGRHRLTGPSLVLCSDGVADSTSSLRTLLGDDLGRPITAEELVAKAIARDHGRPKNDMSVIVLAPAIAEAQPAPVATGRLTVWDGAPRPIRELVHG